MDEIRIFFPVGKLWISPSGVQENSSGCVVVLYVI